MSQAAVDLLLRGYRAFVAGDLAAIEGMLDPEVEWIGVGEVAAIAQRDDVLEILRDRLSEDYSVTVDDLARIGVPCLVVSGSESDPALRTVARRLAASVPDCRFLELEGCGHVTYAERPIEFAAAVQSLAGELAART